MRGRIGSCTEGRGARTARKGGRNEGREPYGISRGDCKFSGAQLTAKRTTLALPLLGRPLHPPAATST